LLPGMELMGCQGLAVPAEVMHHVVRVESSYNPYAIGVVGGRLVRQPRNLPEALATVRMLEGRGFNFSIGLAQVNRYNLQKYGLESYEEAFQPCANLSAGSKILAECYHRANGDWGKSFSCYYSGNFATGFRHGYVQKIYASLRHARGAEATPLAPAIEVVGRTSRRTVPVSRHPLFDAKAAPTTSPVPDEVPVAAIAASPLIEPVQAPVRTRAERARDARIVPTSRVEQIEQAEQIQAQAAAEQPAAVASARLAAVASPEAALIAQAQAADTPAGRPLGRAVPTASVASPATRAVETSRTDPSAKAKPAARGPDRAFIATESDEDDAFVF